MNEQSLVTLRTKTLQLDLSPLIGGAIRNLFDLRSGTAKPLLRESHSDTVSVLDHACFPLVPFVNRIRGGQFTFRGRTVALAPNMASDISPLHGQGWLTPWQVIDEDRTSATLSFTHPAGEWPWSYRATQHFALDDGGLDLRMECTNLSDDPMPCGLGFHPYFSCTPDTVLDTSVDCVWEIDANVLPTVKAPAMGRFDLHQRRVCGQGLDHGFGGWGGRTDIRDATTATHVVQTSPEAKFFQLYSPPTGGIFVAEPVTHANATLNAPEAEWPSLGMRVLDPGESMSLTMRLALAAA